MLKLWTVRNAQGQLIGRYRAETANQAINRVMREQLEKSSQTNTMNLFSRSEFTATIEE